jgi:hypothetical protein
VHGWPRLVQEKSLLYFEKIKDDRVKEHLTDIYEAKFRTDRIKACQNWHHTNRMLKFNKIVTTNTPTALIVSSGQKVKKFNSTTDD